MVRITSRSLGRMLFWASVWHVLERVQPFGKSEIETNDGNL